MNITRFPRIFPLASSDARITNLTWKLFSEWSPLNEFHRILFSKNYLLNSVLCAALLVASRIMNGIHRPVLMFLSNYPINESIACFEIAFTCQTFNFEFSTLAQLLTSLYRAISLFQRAQVRSLDWICNRFD